MARAAVLGRLTWQAGTLVEAHEETATARSLAFEVPGWPGHEAGQHVDIRLTAPDGYTATRSYSIASAAAGERIEVTVQAVPDGEVSPYLREVLDIGEQVELRGPIGGWFVWRPAMDGPVQLVGGGSGVAPLMAMVRERALAGSTIPFRLLYSVRDVGSVFYQDELARLSAPGTGLALTYAYTRVAAPGDPRPPGRVDAALLANATWPVDDYPTTYVCGPTGFVESVADLLTAAGHHPSRIRTERFGPTGGSA